MTQTKGKLLLFLFIIFAAFWTGKPAFAAKIPSMDAPKVTVKSGAVIVKWSKAKGADGYRIYRKASGSKQTLLAETDSGTFRYKDKTVETGYTYTYTVRAIVKSGKSVKEGSCDSLGTRVKISPSAPSSLSAKEEGGRVLIGWTLEDGISGYRIYRKESGQETVKLQDISGNLQNYYWDTTAKPGHTYTYAIRSWVKVSGSRVYSEPVYVKNVKCYPRTVILTGCKRGKINDVLSWKTVYGAEGYRIYKKNKKTNNTWQLVKRVDKSTQSLKIKRDAGGTTAYTVKAYVKVGKKIWTSRKKDTLTNAETKYGDISVLFEGDSITRGYAWGKQATVNYPERISQLTGCSYDNAAVNGSTFVVRSSPNQKRSVLGRLKLGDTDYSGYDVICIAAGTNDYGKNIELGEKGDTSDRTFYGAVTELFQLIREQNPEAEIVVITPLNRVRLGTDWTRSGRNSRNDRGYTLQDYTDALVSVAKSFGAVIYDSEAAGVVTKQNMRTLLSDGLHPTEETYLAIGKSLASFLRKKVFAGLK